MEQFSIGGCQILWFKKRRTSKRDKQAIKVDLEGMSDIIQEAMNYTKNSSRNRNTEIRFFLNTKENSHSYDLRIAYEPGMEGWSITIYRAEHTRRFPENYVGEVVSERWSICQTFRDEDYEAPETI